MIRIRSTSALVVGVCALTLVTAGCAGRTGTPQNGSTTVTGRDTVAAMPEQLRFTAKTIDGKDFSGESLAHRPAVLWFWAPWCPTCRAEAPTMHDVVKANAGKITFVGVAALDKVPAMQDFVREHDLGEMTTIADTDEAVWNRFGVKAQPAYAFVSADGHVDVVPTRMSAAELSSRISALRG
ncbi:MAG: redoxin domain-containing protein [Kutzneria sp.]|nr:redoxin domain-containing protein [Kutzneria sp.]